MAGGRVEHKRTCRRDRPPFGCGFMRSGALLRIGKESGTESEKNEPWKYPRKDSENGLVQNRTSKNFVVIETISYAKSLPSRQKKFITIGVTAGRSTARGSGREIRPPISVEHHPSLIYWFGRSFCLSSPAAGHLKRGSVVSFGNSPSTLWFHLRN